MNCEYCLWKKGCGDEIVDCEHFSPINDDAHIDEIIEEQRIEFRNQWFELLDYLQEGEV